MIGRLQFGGEIFGEARRLSAEELRDTLLSLSGTLNLTMPEGHPFPKGRGFSQHNPFRANYDHAHRSVYLMVQRIQRNCRRRCRRIRVAAR